MTLGKVGIDLGFTFTYLAFLWGKVWTDFLT